MSQTTVKPATTHVSTVTETPTTSVTLASQMLFWQEPLPTAARVTVDTTWTTPMVSVTDATSLADHVTVPTATNAQHVVPMLLSTQTDVTVQVTRTTTTATVSLVT